MTARVFHHEHLVRINDPAIARSFWLTRRELWDGLRHTVLAPQAVDATIDDANVIEEGDGVFRREIRRGACIAVDEVRLVENQSLTICPDARGEFCGSSLTICIEEPAPEMLFVRFTYELIGVGERCEEEDNARRSAYLASDIERVREARLHARRM